MQLARIATCHTQRLRASGICAKRGQDQHCDCEPKRGHSASGQSLEMGAGKTLPAPLVFTLQYRWSARQR